MDYNEFYKQEGFASSEPKRTVQTMAELLPQNSRVLDIGAGDGRHAKYLAEKGLQVVAVEKSEVAFSKLEKLAATHKVTPVKADITVSLPEEQYDAIVCSHVIQDLTPEQALKLAEYAKEHVKPGGYIAASSFLGMSTLGQEIPIEAIINVFSGWKKIVQLNGKSKVAFTGKIRNTMEVLLQKPISYIAMPSRANQ